MGSPQLHCEQIHGNGPKQLLAFFAVGRLRMHGRQLGEERFEKKISLSLSFSPFVVNSEQSLSFGSLPKQQDVAPTATKMKVLLN